MDYDEVIERLYQHNKDYGEGRTQDFFRVCLDCKDAATAIEALRADLARVTAERDGAVEDLRKHREHKCDCCYYADKQSRFPCADCQSPISTYGDGWKWRGIKED